MASRGVHFEPDILLVEDDPLTREQLGDLLSEYFQHLSFAENGEQGLKMYEENKHDIVITDILMPVMDGMEMARRIRSLNPEAQIVIITAYNEIIHSACARQVSVTSVMKPVDIDALVEVINQCTDRIRRKPTRSD